MQGLAYFDMKLTCIKYSLSYCIRQSRAHCVINIYTCQPPLKRQKQSSNSSFLPRTAAAHLPFLLFFSVKLPHGSPSKFPDAFTNSLQRPNEMSRKDRGHRKTELPQHKGNTLLL